VRKAGSALPNGRALTGFAHEYKRTHHYALCRSGGGDPGWSILPLSAPRRREFLDFMNELVALYPGKELHVFWTI